MKHYQLILEFSALIWLAMCLGTVWLSRNVEAEPAQTPCALPYHDEERLLRVLDETLAGIPFELRVCAETVTKGV